MVTYLRLTRERVEYLPEDVRFLNTAVSNNNVSALSLPIYHLYISLNTFTAMAEYEQSHSNSVFHVYLKYQFASRVYLLYNLLLSLFDLARSPVIKR